MTVNLFAVVILAVIGLVCLVVAHTVPFGTPVVWARVLLLVVGWICAGISVIFLVVWLVALLTHTPAAVT